MKKKTVLSHHLAVCNVKQELQISPSSVIPTWFNVACTAHYWMYIVLLIKSE